MPRFLVQFLARVRAAESGAESCYVRAPREDLLTLRALCTRGRATPPSPSILLKRLFGVPSSSTGPAPSALPDDIFWIVLSFWRTSRDDEIDHVLRQLALRRRPA